MESKLKQQCQDSVGELPAGYLHLPTTPIKQEPELTDWISGFSKPVRDGVYQRQHKEYVFFAKFQYGFWRMEHGCIEKAEQEHRTTVFQIRPWRGLAKNPEIQT